MSNYLNEDRGDYVRKFNHIYWGKPVPHTDSVLTNYTDHTYLMAQ